MPDQSGTLLNPNHERRLSVTCRYIDKLLADMESTLHSSESKLAFPHYVSDLSPQQRRVVEDYIRRIRAQLLRVLDGQNIERPSADIPESRSVHASLTFIDIAAEELKPEYMRGYGQIPPAAAVELSGIAGELKGLVRQLDRFLMRGASKEDLQKRLDNLEQTGGEVALLKRLETVVTGHGLVEFRSTLSTIIDRLEDNSFEIAIFGRVNSGKSSLLNAILETDVIPVGVTPITAVPTRLVFGESPAANVWFANRSPERFEISRLQEFVTEQFNPGNEKHVARIVVQLRSRRLEDGVVFVDTPGLGSLATVGASETLAYLPRCDLGVVMIDAASTLTSEDLQTIQALYQSRVPATLLLSKADLVNSGDRARVAEYIREHIRKNLNLNLNVHPVSIVEEQKDLIELWFEEDIAPLYTQRQELKIRSIRRKLGALRQSIQAGLRVRLGRGHHLSPKMVEQLRDLEAELRQASGHLEEMPNIARRVSNDLECAGVQILRIAAATLVEARSAQAKSDQAAELVRHSITRTINEHTDTLRRDMDSLVQKSLETLRSCAKMLEIEDIPAEQEFSNIVREMPRFDPGQFSFRLGKPFVLPIFGKKLLGAMISKRLTELIGDQINESLAAYRAVLYDWSERTLNQLQRRFHAYADNYRARIEALTSQERGSEDDAVRRDLQALETQCTEAPLAP